MKKDRLLRLAALLDVVPEEKFDMGWWGVKPKQTEPFAHVSGGPVCASSACALGWATTIPEFKALGLELVATPDSQFAHIRLGYFINSEAAAHLFGISEDRAMQLFESGRSTAKDKARQIRRLVRTGRVA